MSIDNVIDIAAGSAHVLALKETAPSGHGAPTTTASSATARPIDRNVPVQVQGLSSVKAVAAGLMYSVALKDDGTVWAWGYNKNGQLGDGETSRYEPDAGQGRRA